MGQMCAASVKRGLTVTEQLALVLAGGGIAGIAWETGVLLGIQDEAPSAVRRLLHADILLGTSAGSAVAAQISSGTSLAELYARQLAPLTHRSSLRTSTSTS